jgi:cyclic pyranopterin phosphate synthase
MADTPRLSHVDERGAARMVDVAGKAVTHRRAVATAFVRMLPATLDMIVEGRAPKGDVIAVARTAGIMAAKRTSDLVPLCHPLPITHAAVDLETGVEMEALTAAGIAAVTLYDMCKAVDRGMVVTDLMLLSKEGGRSGSWSRTADSEEDPT